MTTPYQSKSFESRPLSVPRPASAQAGAYRTPRADGFRLAEVEFNAEGGRSPAAMLRELRITCELTPTLEIIYPDVQLLPPQRVELSLWQEWTDGPLHRACLRRGYDFELLKSSGLHVGADGLRNVERFRAWGFAPHEIEPAYFPARLTKGVPAAYASAGLLERAIYSLSLPTSVLGKLITSFETHAKRLGHLWSPRLGASQIEERVIGSLIALGDEARTAGAEHRLHRPFTTHLADLEALRP